jgi:hypothetical protein
MLFSIMAPRIESLTETDRQILKVGNFSQRIFGAVQFILNFLIRTKNVQFGFVSLFEGRQCSQIKATRPEFDYNKENKV